MHYLYDIWVNWFEGEEKGYNVFHYHEWRKEDGIEMLDQIPVLYITDSLFDYIENSLQPLPQSLIQSIYKKTYARKGYGRRVIQYACIVTDGKDVLAFDTLGYDRPFRKSRLIPRQESQIHSMYTKLKRRNDPLPKGQVSKEKQGIWDFREEEIIGLTRRERSLKKILFICLEQLRRITNKEEMSYWLSEWKGENVLLHKTSLSIESMWQELYEEMLEGWTASHEQFLRQVVQKYPILKELWKKEQHDYVNEENQP